MLEPINDPIAEANPAETVAATIANVSKVEFFNRSVKIGESSTPLSASVTSNRATNATRLLSTGHPFSNGDVVHFPAGPHHPPRMTRSTAPLTSRRAACDPTRSTSTMSASS